jgi:N-methylhydantoinase B
MNQAMDMVTMNILEQAMVSICRQMGITLMKTSYSTIFNEALDFTCGIASPDGNMISVAEFNPAHIGAMNVLMRSCLQEISSDAEPGDVIVHNDPYRGGLHTPEHTFYKPIFVDGELMAFAVAIGHIAEIGGLVPGAFASEATEIFHEGLRIPPVRIRRRGEDVADVWKLLLAPGANSTPELWRLPSSDQRSRFRRARVDCPDPEVWPRGVYENDSGPPGLF